MPLFAILLSIFGLEILASNKSEASFASIFGFLCRLLNKKCGCANLQGSDKISFTLVTKCSPWFCHPGKVSLAGKSLTQDLCARKVKKIVMTRWVSFCRFRSHRSLFAVVLHREISELDRHTFRSFSRGIDHLKLENKFLINTWTHVGGWKFCGLCMQPFRSHAKVAILKISHQCGIEFFRLCEVVASGKASKQNALNVCGISVRVVIVTCIPVPPQHKLQQFRSCAFLLLSKGQFFDLAWVCVSLSWALNQNVELGTFCWPL